MNELRKLELGNQEPRDMWEETETLPEGALFPELEVMSPKELSEAARSPRSEANQLTTPGALGQAPWFETQPGVVGSQRSESNVPVVSRTSETRMIIDFPVLEQATRLGSAEGISATLKVLDNYNEI